MNKVGKPTSKTAYIDLTNEKQEKAIKSITSSKKQSISPKNVNKTPDTKQLDERKTDVQCYKDICDKMKTGGSHFAQMCFDKIKSSEIPEHKPEEFFSAIGHAIKGAVVKSVITTNLKDLLKTLREHPEQLFILVLRFAASDWLIKTLNDVYSKDTRFGRLHAAFIPGKIKTVIDKSQKSKETINEKNTKEISQNILKAAKQILPIIKDKNPTIKKLSMESTLDTIKKNLPTDKECPAVAEKLVKELLQVANLHLTEPESRPDHDLLKKILDKTVEILQKKK